MAATTTTIRVRERDAKRLMVLKRRSGKPVIRLVQEAIDQYESVGSGNGVSEVAAGKGGDGVNVATPKITKRQPIP